MPAKKAETGDGRRERVRQDGKRGTIVVPYYQRVEIGGENLKKVWEYIDFQIFKFWEGPDDEQYYYGYCPLFAPLKMDEEYPTYTIRISFEKPEPVVELFKRRN